MCNTVSCRWYALRCVVFRVVMCDMWCCDVLLCGVRCRDVWGGGVWCCSVRRCVVLCYIITRCRMVYRTMICVVYHVVMYHDVGY